ncbi:hypothetical protein GCM10028800_21480 [Nesterenkonia populi]
MIKRTLRTSIVAGFLGSSAALGVGATAQGADASQYPCGFTGLESQGVINSTLDRVFGTDGPPYEEAIYRNCENTAVGVSVLYSTNRSEEFCVAANGQVRLTPNPDIGAPELAARIDTISC